VILEVKLHASFGERLVSARKMAGLSLAALAEKTGNLVTRQAINKYERIRDVVDKHDKVR